MRKAAAAPQAKASKVATIQQSDARGPTPCNNNELRKATRHLGQLFDDVIGASGLRAAQHGLLYYISAMDRPTMKALAQALVMDLSALGHTLKPLTRDGFVRLETDERDARAKRVSLTSEGEAKLAETIQLWREAQGRFEAALGSDQARALREALSEISSDAFGTAFREGRPMRDLAKTR
jgi:DNA-binding MarR family transcriptional regulator